MIKCIKNENLVCNANNTKHCAECTVIKSDFNFDEFIKAANGLMKLKAKRERRHYASTRRIKNV